jgi:hypothetical protein
MLRREAFANAFSAAAVIFYIFLFLLKIIAPPFFRLFLNSQFLGADISSQIPKFNIINFMGTLIAILITTWIIGYLVASIYNNQLKK